MMIKKTAVPFTIIIIILALAALSYSLPIATCNTNQYAGTGDWTINESTYCSDGELNISGSITVNNSAYLNLTNTTLNIGQVTNYEHSINIGSTSAGLFIKDSTIKSNNSNRYRFIINRSSMIIGSTISDTGNLGLVLNDDGNYIDNSRFLNNQIALYFFSNNNEVYNSYFSNNDYGIYLNSNLDNNSFENLTMVSTGSEALWIQSGITDHYFKNITIDSCFLAVRIQNANNFTFKDVHVSNYGTYAFNIGFDSTLNIYDSTFETSGTDTFLLGSNNSMKLYNVSFDKTRTDIGSESSIELYHQVRFNTTDIDSSNELEDTNVTLYYNDSGTYKHGSSMLTLIDGLTPTITLFEGLLLPDFNGVSVNNSRNPYNITLKKEGYYDKDDTVTIDHSGTYSFQLEEIDSIPPTISILYPNNNSMFGYKDINFSFSVTDNKMHSLNCSLYIDSSEALLENNISNGSILTTNYTFEEGNHSWYINCTDSLNYNNSEERSITVDNTPPTITSYTPNSTINETQSILLSFNFTDSITGIGNYSITINSSRINLTSYSDSYNLITDHFSSGNYSVTYLARDKANNTVSIIASIEVLDNPIAPIIDHYSPNITTYISEGDDIHLNFSYFDTDNNVIYSNITMEGILLTENNLSFTLLNISQGTRNITFLVKDKDGLIASKNISLIVNDTYALANFYFIPNLVNESENISFYDNSTIVFDPISSWFWDFNDGTNNTLADPIHRFNHNGTYDVTLTIVDSDGSTSFTTRSIEVQNVPMNFTIVSNSTQGTTPLSISFSQTIHSGNPQFTYHWDFNDSSTSNTTTKDHVFSYPGTYNVTLIMTDSDGDIGKDWIVINASLGPDTIPPNITQLAPISPSYSSNTSQTIEFAVSDDRAGMINCSLYFNSTLNLSIAISNNTTSNFSFNNLSQGIYAWHISCTDSINTVNSSVHNLTIDYTPPNVSFSLSTTTFEEGDTPSYSCTGTDNLDPYVSVLIYNLHTDNAGTRDAYCVAEDDSGNKRTSTSISYTVEKKTISSSGGGGRVSYTEEPIEEETVEEEPVVEEETEEPIVFDEEEDVAEDIPEEEIIEENKVILPGINAYGEQEKSKIKTRGFNTGTFNSIIRHDQPYVVTRTYDIKDNSTYINYTIKNTGLVAFKRIGLFVHIHKNVTNSTDNIFGDYHTIEKDSKILFMSYNLSAKKTLDFSFVINRTIKEADLDLILHNVSLEMSEEEFRRLMEKANRTNDEIIITKKVVAFDNLTDVKIDVLPKSDVENLTVLLEIPKCLAETISEIEFENKEYEIIKDDPLVAFSYASLSENTKIEFEVLKSVDKDCWEQIRTMPIAEVIKDKIIVNDNKKIFFALAIILAINFFAIGFNLFQKKTEKTDKKSIFYKIEFGIVETILILIIVLNIIDFAKLLTPDLDFAKKILSLSILGLLLYEAKLEKIFYGRERRFETFFILIANFMLLINVLIDFVFISYNEIIEEHHHAIVLHLYQVIIDFELSHPGLITSYSMIGGVGIIVLLSFFDIFKDIKRPSLMEALHIEGKPKGIISMAERFITSIIVYISFYIIFFRYFMEWLAISVDATLMVVAIIIYLVRFIIKNAHKYEKEHLINKIGNVGEDFYKKFVGLFQYRYTILFGLSGILVLHLLVDLGNYLVPFLFQFQDVLYFSQIGTTHPNLIYILDQLYTQDIIHNITITISYLLNVFFLISCMVFPGYIWYDIYKNHSTHISRYWIAGFFASITNYALMPLILVTSIESNNILGVDIIFKLVQNQHLEAIISISLAVGITSYLMSRNLTLRNGLRLIGSFAILLFFSFYVYNYLKSWMVTLFPQIIELFAVHNFYSIFLGSLLALFLGIISLFYAASYVYFIRLVYREWFVKKHVSHNLARKAKEISHDFHGKGFTRLKIISLIKEADSLRRKEISDLEIKEKLYEKGVPPDLIDRIIFD